MAQCFKRKESLADAVKRIGTERLEHALAGLRDCRRSEAVHGARKDIKKVRALLRLVRAGMAKGEFRPLNASLRAANAALAAPRDAYIRSQTVRTLAGHFKRQLAPRAMRRLRAELNRDTRAALRRFNRKKAAHTVTRHLRRAIASLTGLELCGDDEQLLGRGIKESYRHGRRAHRAARKSQAAEDFHAWRKRTKDLWYQIKTLQPIWPEELAAMSHELRTLGQHLGADHDLTLLRMDVQCREPGPPGEREMLDGLVAQRQRELRTAALAIGTRWYGEKPSRFRERLMGYWQAWRRGSWSG